ncbi:MAG: hypothetical protein ACQESP_05115 [Candidatus Muiribacteriota bacterium]
MKKILIINLFKNKEKNFKLILNTFPPEKYSHIIYTEIPDINLKQFENIIFIQPTQYDKDFLKEYLMLKQKNVKKLIILKQNKLKIKNLKNIYYQDYLIIKTLKFLKLIR